MPAGPRRLPFRWRTRGGSRRGDPLAAPQAAPGEEGDPCFLFCHVLTALAHRPVRRRPDAALRQKLRAVLGGEGGRPGEAERPGVRVKGGRCPGRSRPAAGLLSLPSTSSDGAGGGFSRASALAAPFEKLNGEG